MNLSIGWRTDNPPPIENDYLVTYDSGRMDICHWDNRDFYGRPQNSDVDYRWYADQYCKVVAWMLLPEPYKGQRMSDICIYFDTCIYSGTCERRDKGISFANHLPCCKYKEKESEEAENETSNFGSGS